jgi:hypothetical protein
VDAPESTPLGLKKAMLMATRPGEIALLQEPEEARPGVLAVAPIAGGPPRPILEDVINADWLPDGSKFLIDRWTQGKEQVEFPAGKVLYATTGSIGSPRLSPGGDRIALIDYPIVGDNRGSVVVVDLAGRAKKLSGLWFDIGGLAWSPGGEEVWFTATQSGLNRALWGVSLSGRERLVLRVPGRLTIHDVFRDGRAVLSQDSYLGEMRGQAPGEPREHDYSWLDMTDPAGISSDGRNVVFTEWGNGGGAKYSVFLRKTDGSPPVRLGEGWAMGLSPDGKWVLALTVETPGKLVLIPTGAGARRELPRGTIDVYHSASWFPDAKRIAIRASEKDRPVQVFVQSIDSGAPRAITSQTIEGTLVSPDGKWIVAFPSQPGSSFSLYPVGGGEPRPIPGLSQNFDPRQWTSDGKELVVVEVPVAFRASSAKIWRLNVETGEKRLWRTIGPDDPSGAFALTNVRMTPDGTAYFYRVTRIFSDLFVVEGLK